MTNFVEATNCHHHYIWQAAHHASEGDAVYVDNDEQMDSHELVYHDHASTTENQNDSDEFRVESDDVSDVDEENEEHFLDHSHDDTDSFFASQRQSRGGGGGTRGGGPGRYWDTRLGTQPDRSALRHFGGIARPENRSAAKKPTPNGCAAWRFPPTVKKL